MCTTAVVLSNHSPVKSRVLNHGVPLTWELGYQTDASSEFEALLGHVRCCVWQLWQPVGWWGCAGNMPMAMRCLEEFWILWSACFFWIYILYQIMKIEYGNIQKLYTDICWLLYLGMLNSIASSHLCVKGGDAAPFLHMSWSPLERFGMQGGNLHPKTWDSKNGITANWSLKKTKPWEQMEQDKLHLVKQVGSFQPIGFVLQRCDFEGCRKSPDSGSMIFNKACCKITSI